MSVTAAMTPSRPLDGVSILSPLMFSLPAPFARKNTSRPFPAVISYRTTGGVLSLVLTRISGCATMDLRASR